VRCEGVPILPQRSRRLNDENEWVKTLGNKDMLLHMKRTTLVLDPGIHLELKRRAASEGRTFTEVLERTLRLGLQAQAALRRGRERLPSYDLGPFLVDPADRAAVLGLPSLEPRDESS